VPSPSTDIGGTLLRIARQSVAAAVRGCAHAAPELETLPAALAEPRAAFVSIHRDGHLRGCIGTLEATTPLALAVAEVARGAALRDVRVAPLTEDELTDIRIAVSVLSPPQRVPAGNRQQLLAALRPGVDGLLLEDGPHRATFLPKVWEQLPAPGQFLDRLLEKAGLGAGYWSDELRCYRYQATDYAEPGAPP